METHDFQESIRLQRAAKVEALELTPYRSARSLTEKEARFPGFRQRKVNYRAGQQLTPGALILPVDFVMHESVPMALSDGVKLYSDIFLPSRFQDISKEITHATPVPALIVWSPYGKQMGTTLLDDFPMRAGVPKDWLSGLQKWEGPDPARWCQHDYAIINVDTRGAYTSEGDLMVFGYQEAEDGAEFTTWISEQPWCNGKVGFCGNSWLAIMQWKIGSLRPKGLEALAPWEGLDDLYRESVCPGGIPQIGFNSSIQDQLVSQGKLEDMSQAVTEHPLWNSYWEDKKANPKRINKPVYTVASYTNPVHVTGTFRAWTEVPESVPKYLRVNNSQEWSDFYEDTNQKDLKRFFDYYLKNIENGWPSTPKVRLSVLRFGLGDIADTVNRAEADWPLRRTTFKRYFLTEDKLMSLESSSIKAGTVQYDANTGKAVFQYVITAEMETTGYFMAHLAMSCAEHDEMDVFVQVEKIVKHWRQGTMTIKPHSVIARSLLKYVAHDWQLGLSKVGLLFHWGPSGVLRASHALDKDKSSLLERPLYSHKRKIPLKKGEVRVLDVPISPYGMYWEKGDVLQFTVSGRPINPFPLPGLKGPETDNKGIHTIYCGGRETESSYLLVPVV